MPRWCGCCNQPAPAPTPWGGSCLCGWQARSCEYGCRRIELRIALAWRLFCAVCRAAAYGCRRIELRIALAWRVVRVPLRTDLQMAAEFCSAGAIENVARLGVRASVGGLGGLVANTEEDEGK